MKHKQSMMGFVSGILVSVLLAGAVLPAVAAGTSIWVDSGVKVYVNDIPIDAGDTHGNPDAFIYNGTTYVAAAAASQPSARGRLREPGRRGRCALAQADRFLGV